MENHRYKLEPYKSLSDRFTCPSCGEKKKFTRYIDVTTGDQLADHCGRCERSDSCGYHYTPKDYFKENPDHKPKDFQKFATVPAPPKREPSYIDKSVFRQSLGFNLNNTFHSFLLALFGKEQAENLINRYHIGTTKNHEAIFYQVDLYRNIRSGKLMKYNLTASQETFLGKDCKRDKSTNPNWVHTKLKLPDFNLTQCLVGEHLLKDGKIIALVESAKTAIIASVYFPQFTWVSSEGKEGLNIDKLKVLKGKDVILFPDLNAFDKWKEKAKLMTFCKSVTVSDLLESIATDAERASGLDLADYLLRSAPPKEEPQKIEIEPIKLSEGKPHELIKYFLTDTKFLNYDIFTVDGIEIDSLPFDIGFHLGILANPTPEQINEALESKPAKPFLVGYNLGVIDSEKESKREYSIKILSLIKIELGNR